MKLAKRTYTFPAELIQRFEQRLSAGERSRVIAQLIQDWLDQHDREELRRRVVDGCFDMAELYRDIDREWTSASDEVWRKRG